LNEAIGSYGSRMLMDIMNHDHGLNGEDTVLCSHLFEENLRKLLCSSAAENIIEKIKAELMKDIAF
jgi:hypothetical protein